MPDPTTVKPSVDINEIVERHVQRYQWGDDTLHGAIRSAIDEALSQSVPAVWVVVHNLEGNISGVYPTEEAAQRARRGWERVERQSFQE